VPVVSGDRVVGVVSPAALLSWLHEQLDDSEPRDGPST
jgi:hypothetical protein